MVSSRSASVHSDLTVHVSLLFYLCLVKCSCWLKKSRFPPPQPPQHLTCATRFLKRTQKSASQAASLEMSFRIKVYKITSYISQASLVES